MRYAIDRSANSKHKEGCPRAGSVSRAGRRARRRRIGIVLLLTNVVTTYVMMIYAWDAAVAEGPAAPVWGLNIEEQGSLVFYLFLAGEISFLFSIYVLGADSWGKFRRIFVWEAPAD